MEGEVVGDHFLRTVVAAGEGEEEATVVVAVVVVAVAADVVGMVETKEGKKNQSKQTSLPPCLPSCLRSKPRPCLTHHLAC